MEYNNHFAILTLFLFATYSFPKNAPNFGFEKIAGWI